MAGAKQQVEDAPTFVAESLASAASSAINSLEGISTLFLPDRALCYVRQSRAIYRYSDSSNEAADGSVWAADPNDDELHVRVSRAAHASDPVAEPGIHHVAVIFPVQP